jgi:hypothetical protein
MGVRNCEELGRNLQKNVSRLIANDDLVKLLYYTDENPLGHSALSKEDKQKEIFEKLIKTVPRVGTKDTANSVVVVYI